MAYKILIGFKQTLNDKKITQNYPTSCSTHVQFNSLTRFQHLIDINNN